MDQDWPGASWTEQTYLIMEYLIEFYLYQLFSETLFLAMSSVLGGFERAEKKKESVFLSSARIYVRT